MKDKLFLIYGDEQYLINKKINEIVDINNTVVYDMAICTMEEVKEDVTSYSMFSNNKDIICKNCTFLTSTASDKNNLVILGEILNIKLENRLILSVEGKIDERKKVVKELVKLSNTYFFEKIKDYEMSKFIGEEFKKMGYKIDASTLNYFHSYVGNNLSVISKEIEKMDLYKDNKEITKDDINKISSKALEDNIFDLVDAVANRNINRALRVYDDLLLVNEEEIKIISLLADQFRLIYQTKSMYNSGYPKEVILKELGVHPYRIQLAKGSTVSIEDAKSNIFKLFDLDVAIKTGKKDKKIAFKIFLLEL